ncbi:hypothetical protein PAAG_11692 [Paracoccidioides lutzii Pb01]|uniref:Uncharacterized protein n=1 Tax=Paracoccidioides lutzii (strain ATCC MYA-826 / Pb01) TaxID=502779 RepID=A0A0A2V189_PARBA|nr:hypothetical protein PAAG_11692 [Paracoccidioides lutzii Pb01]KGQ01566.1 hypothetical protein PAAG_11692 [Paracoccidioides lutzii Pb01]
MPANLYFLPGFSRTGQKALQVYLELLSMAQFLLSVVLFIPIYFESFLQLEPVPVSIDMLPLCTIISLSALVTAFGDWYSNRYSGPYGLVGSLPTAGTGLLTLFNRKASRSRRPGLQTSEAMGLGIIFPTLIISLQMRSDGAVSGVALCSGMFSNTFSAEVAEREPLPRGLSLSSDGNSALALIPLLKKLDISVHDT